MAPETATKPGLIVQKYGGTSLSSPVRIREIAARIAERAAAGYSLVVIVSAMGKSTDELLSLAHEITARPPRRELDMLLTVGERVSMALMSMALNAIGCPAISFTGSQCGIVTNVSHSRALIEEIRPGRIIEELERGKVVIVAGFQGVSRTREITTLGRGGSDTTAVAIAATLGAQHCEIYSDYCGVFTADPRVVPHAKCIPHIGYETMLELAALGARVLHYRAADIARTHGVHLRLLSSFETGDGTEVGEANDVEATIVKSVASNKNVYGIGLKGPAADVTKLMKEIGKLDIEIIGFHRVQENDKSAARFVINADDGERLKQIAEQYDSVATEVADDIAMVSLVGSGFAGNSLAITTIESALDDAEIPVLFTTTSPLSVTCVVPATACDNAIHKLHADFIEDKS